MPGINTGCLAEHGDYILVEKLVEPVFTNYDYNRSFPSLNIFQRLKLILLKFIFSILSKLYIWVRMK